MAAVFLAIGGLAAIILALNWFLGANPSALGRGLRRGLFALAAVALGVVLIFLVRLGPEMLEGLLGLAVLIATTLVPRWLRRRSTSGFSSPGAGQRTEVRTAFLRAWIEHATGDVGGAVVAGRFSGRTLDSLTEADLLVLRREIASDADSLRVLEAYLDRRLGSAWRHSEQSSPNSPRGDMSRREALDVLGLTEGATPEEVRSAHRRLIQRVHPDVGGSADLAARINRAKDVLLG
jgi:hypothetical protein